MTRITQNNKKTRCAQDDNGAMDQLAYNPAMQTWIECAKTDYGIDLSPLQVGQFDTFMQELLEWNQKFNLTAIRDEEGIQIKHFLDSLSVIMAFS